MHPNLRSLEKEKTRLARLRLRIVKRRKSTHWEMKTMENAIRSMKNNKCRDASGLMNELLKPGVAGHDFKMSLLSLMNKIKDQLEIPEMMKHVNISLIPKPGKRNLRIIFNHRGIFLIHKYRSLLMRMLLDDEYDTIDKYMSDSNVGGRKDIGICDHLFVINGIIQEHCTSQSKPITIQIFDYKTCFYSMWQDEVINELYDAGVQDDKLALLHKIYETNIIKVKTPAGLSDARNVENIICQGDPWGSMECGVMVDGFGKKAWTQRWSPTNTRAKFQCPF